MLHRPNAPWTHNLTLSPQYHYIDTQRKKNNIEMDKNTVQLSLLSKFKG